MCADARMRAHMYAQTHVAACVYLSLVCTDSLPSAYVCVHAGRVTDRSSSHFHLVLARHDVSVPAGHELEHHHAFVVVVAHVVALVVAAGRRELARASRRRCPIAASATRGELARLQARYLAAPPLPQRPPLPAPTPCLTLGMCPVSWYK